MPREVSYKGVVGTVRKIAFHEGPKVSEVKSGFVLDFFDVVPVKVPFLQALYNGLVPGLQRQMAFSAVRIGAYETVKQFYASKAKGKGGSVVK